ncbi:hypothetical protein ACFZCT_30535 [Streptomyces qaidamensis]|uniref:hypothetical protein n=1 Tax=Streptomyces qaidamensis TaxID=1783515 RepID=UPI0036EFA7EE
MHALVPLNSVGDVAPDWWLVLVRGLVGLVGGCICARPQPCLPETDLRPLLCGLAAGLGIPYAVQALT